MSVGWLRLSGRSWPRRPCGAEQSEQPGQRPGLAGSEQLQGQRLRRQPGHTTSNRWCSRCRNRSSLRSSCRRSRSWLRSSSTCSTCERTDGSGSNPSCNRTSRHSRKQARSSRPGNRSWLRSSCRRRSSRQSHSTDLRNHSWLRSSCSCSNAYERTSGSGSNPSCSSS